MGTSGKKIFAVAIGLLLAAGVPYVAATTVYADPASGSGQECPCGEKCECGHGKGCDCRGHHGKHEGMHCKEGGHMHGKPRAGGPAMKEDEAAGFGILETPDGPRFEGEVAPDESGAPRQVRGWTWEANKRAIAEPHRPVAPLLPSPTPRAAGG